jgi:hypothetical protein
MLLTDLLKLFSTNFNISEERFNDIVESNNIRLTQRLLVKITDEKKINEHTNNVSTNINSTTTNLINNECITSNDSDTNLKKKQEGRGRGRPRKTKELAEETNVIIEVEVITLEEKEFYKTSENVVMNKEMEILGILKNGKIVKQDK